MEHYIAWLYERVEQMYRILKTTGSIFLHCDWPLMPKLKCQF
ncbi:MAG: site-specific DNA-methyltransferase [Bacteroidales bacterium]|nr:site-specific DNA-methyltransferase [Bacteroidales bacterium]